MESFLACWAGVRVMFAIAAADRPPRPGRPPWACCSCALATLATPTNKAAAIIAVRTILMGFLLVRIEGVMNAGAASDHRRLLRVRQIPRFGNLSGPIQLRGPLAQDSKTAKLSALQ